MTIDVLAYHFVFTLKMVFFFYLQHTTGHIHTFASPKINTHFGNDIIILLDITKQAAYKNQEVPQL